MAPKLYLFLFQVLIFKVCLSQVPTLKQYVVTGLSPQTSSLSGLQTLNLASHTPKSNANVASLSTLANILSGVKGLAPQSSSQSSLSDFQTILSNPATKSTSNLASLSALANLLSTGVPMSQLTSTLSGVPTSQLTSALSGIPASQLTSALSGISASQLTSALSGIPASQLTTTAPLLSALTSELAPAAPTQTSNGVDMELLNNLAIALQLMIVNNILNSPSSEPATPEPVVVPGYPLYENVEPVTPIAVSYAPIKNPYSHPTPMSHSHPPTQTQPYYHQNTYETQPTYNTPPPPSMPNANFVGSSGFSDPNPLMSSVPQANPYGSPNGRTGMTLMSPYEALSPNSQYSDPIINSPYGSVMTSKKDFQSPYTAILAADREKDLFSMNDLFS